jgi:queuosine precursor transporter
MRASVLGDELASRGEFLYLLLGGIFIGSLVVTNVIAGKFFVLFGHTLSCGIIAYPLTFLATDLISELFGQVRAGLVVKVGFVVSAFVTAVLVLANSVPVAETTYVQQAAFSAVFGITPGVFFGSMCAYLAAQLLDVRVFHFWRRLTNGRHLWLRNNASTVVSQLLDTVIVVTVTLVLWPSIDGDPATAPIGRATVLELIVGQYFFKAAVALFDTPLFYLGTQWLGAWAQATPVAPAAAE